MSAYRTTIGLALLGLVLLFTSCVDFEKQSLSFRYFPEQDKLLIFQKYAGIYGNSDKGGKLTKKEEQEFDSVMTSERTFFFANWIFEYNRAQLVEQAVKLEEPKPDETAAQAELRRRGVQLCQILIDNIKVKNGAAYLNQEKKLSGYQFVTINRFSQILSQGNRVISAWLKSEELKDMSPETIKMLRDTEDDYKWLSVNGNQLVVRFPCSQEDFGKLREKLFADAIATVDDPAAEADEMRENLRPAIELMKNPIWMSFENKVVTITCGTPDGDSCDLNVQLKDTYRPNMVDYVTDKYGVAVDPKTDELRREFLKLAK